MIICSKSSTDLILSKHAGMSIWDMRGRILIFCTSDAAARFMVWMMELNVDWREGAVKGYGAEKGSARLAIYASGLKGIQ
jgi:hypothetical protein